MNGAKLPAEKIPPGKTYQTIKNLKKPQQSSSSKSSKIVFVSGSSQGNDGWSASTAKVLSKLIKVLPTNSFPSLSITQDRLHGVAPPIVALEAVAAQKAFEQAEAAKKNPVNQAAPVKPAQVKSPATEKVIPVQPKPVAPVQSKPVQAKQVQANKLINTENRKD